MNIDNPVNDPIIEKYNGGHDIYYTPTILYYGKDKSTPSLYEGDYSKATIQPFIVGACSKDGFKSATGKDLEVDLEDLEEMDGKSSQAVAKYGNTMADIGFLRELGEAAMDGLVDDFGARGGGYIPQFHGRAIKLAPGPYDTFRVKPDRSKHHGPELLL